MSNERQTNFSKQNLAKCALSVGLVEFDKILTHVKRDITNLAG